MGESRDLPFEPGCISWPIRVRPRMLRGEGQALRCADCCYVGSRRGEESESEKWEAGRRRGESERGGVVSRDEAME